MTSGQLKRGSSPAALAVLALGLAACGGSEPVPAARAPAPAPAPPPFQAEPVEVALGASGEKVTLLTKEGGGFTLDGEDFGGGELTAGNGATYTLTLADGNWAAAFKPAEVAVTLGSSGVSLNLATTEGGGFTLDGEDFAGGEVLAGGMTYIVTLREDGLPMATFKPRAVAVTLGSSGDSVTLLTTEGGGFTLDGEDFAGGALAASDGSMYLVSLGEDGLWTARYQASSVMVMLGASGGSVTVTRNEDGAYWISESPLMSGDTVTGSNGASYTLTMDGEGAWSASFNPAPVTVAAGASGTVTLMTTEDGGWTLDGAPLLPGASYTASNGNEYVLSLSGGSWTAVYQPAMMPIAGTGLVAISLEDGTGYQVGASRLPVSGIGDVTVDGATYHVRMDAGMLAGSRFDGPIDSDTVMTTVKTKATDSTAAVRLAHPTLSADDSATAANELGTRLKVAGEEFSVGELLERGIAPARGKSIVARARDGLQDLLLDTRALTSALSESSPATLRSELRKLWGTHSSPNSANAQTYVNSIFGAGTVDLSNKEDVEGALASLIDALSGADAFAAATAEGGGGPFAAAKLSGTAAARAFEALDSGSRASLGATGPTRYGTVFREVRTRATEDLTFIRIARPVKWVALHAVAPIPQWIGITAVHPPVNPHPTLGFRNNPLGEGELTKVPTGTASGSSGVPIVLETALGNDDASKQAVKSALEAIIKSSGVSGVTVATPTVTGTVDPIFELRLTYTSGQISFDLTQAVKFRRVHFALTSIVGDVGAFAYSTGPETGRTRFVTVSGNAYYKGGTRAVTGAGAMYAGDMELKINFGTRRVDGLVTNLRDTEGNAWRYFHEDVASIALPRATARDAIAGVNWKSAAAGHATLTYARNADIRSTTIAATFEGKLLGGDGAEAGSAATGVWTLGGGPLEKSNYLAGGYGVTRGADRPDRQPEPLAADVARAAVSEAVSGASAAIADGKLNITAQRYGWTIDNEAPAGRRWSYGMAAGANARRTYSVDLTAALGNEGLETVTSGDRHVDLLRANLRKVRDDLEALTARGIQATARGRKWRLAQALTGTQLFGVAGTDTSQANNTTKAAAFPDKLDGTYDKDLALDTVDKVLRALASEAALAAALRANEGGIFTRDDSQPETTVAAADLWSRRESQAMTFAGMTNYTRFGAWRIQNGASAIEADGTRERESGRFSYSPLAPAVIASTAGLGYTVGGSATYTGKAVALQGQRFYQGDAEVTVGWRAAAGNAPDGTLVAAFSNLADAETGDPLMFHLAETVSGGIQRRSHEVRDIVFSGIDIRSNGANHVLFGETADTTLVKIVPADRALPEQRTLAIGATTTARRISGLFAGDGTAHPLAVIGEWLLGENRLPASPAAGDLQIGSGEALQAGFGADLPAP